MMGHWDGWCGGTNPQGIHPVGQRGEAGCREAPVHKVGQAWTWVKCPREGSREETELRVSRRRKGLFAKDGIPRAVGEKGGMCVGKGWNWAPGAQ